MAESPLLVYVDCSVRAHTGVCLDCQHRTPESEATAELPYQHVPADCVLGVLHHWPRCCCDSDSTPCEYLNKVSETPIFIVERSDMWGELELRFCYWSKKLQRFHNVGEPKLKFYIKLARNACFPEAYFPIGEENELSPNITFRSAWGFWEHSGLIKKGDPKISKDGRYAALPDHRVRPRAPPRGSGIAAWSSYMLERLHYTFTPTYLERLPDPRPSLGLSRVKDTVEPMEIDEDVIG